MKTKLETQELKAECNSKEFFSCDFNKQTCATSVQEINPDLKPLRIVRKPNLFIIVTFLTILLFTNGCAVMCDVADILLETPLPTTQVVIVTPSHHFSSYNHAPHYRSSN